MSENASNFYTVGGTLECDARSYVPRDADKLLQKHLEAGHYCYVLNPRQVGKSSLMIQVAESLKAKGVHVAIVDLQAVSKSSTDELWYYSVLRQIGRGLGLEDALRKYWLQTKQSGMDADLISPLERWIGALKDVVLKERAGRIVVFVDEIDLVRSYTQFSADEFFLAIRYLHGEQKQNNELSRLSFCLIGVATPSDLIRDTRVTSFNIGERVELQDFTKSEAASLAVGLGRKTDVNTRLLHRILYWTGGHPYLTQSLCQAVAADAAGTNSAAVDRICNKLFLSPDMHGKDTNLLFVRDRMLLKEAAQRESRSEAELVGLLSLYSQIHKGKRVPAHESNPLVSILTLSGIARVKGGFLTTRNRIYQSVFNEEWIASNLPDAELKKQRTHYRRKLVGLGVAALVLITVLSTSTAFAFWQKRKADRTAEQLGVTKGSLDRTKENLDETRRSLDQRERDLQAAIANHKLEIAVKNKDLGAKEIEIEEKTRAAQKTTEEANDQKLIADERLKSVNRLEYVAKVNLAKSLYDDGNIDSVVKVLGETDKRHRGVEWSFLNHLLEGWVSFANAGVDQIRELKFSPDGKHLVAKGFFYPLFVWDPQTGQQEDLIVGDDLRRDSTSDYAFSPDGRWLASCGSANGLILWDTSTNPWQRLPVPNVTQNETFKFVSFTSDSKELLTVSERDYEFFLRRWDIQTRNQIGTGKDLKEVRIQFGIKNLKVIKFAFSEHLLIRYEEPVPETDTYKPEVALLNFISRTPLVKEFPDEQYSYAFSSDGQMMADFQHGSGGISVRATFNREERWEQLDGSTSSREWTDIAFSRNGKLIAALNPREVNIWETKTRKRVRVIPLPSNLYKSIAFSPDGLKLAIGGFNDNGSEGALTLWDVYSQADVFSFNREEFRAASADGTKVVTQNADSYLNLWSTLKRESIGTPITASRWEIGSVSFSPTGDHFVAYSRGLEGGRKRRLRLWNAANGTEVRLRLQADCGFVASSLFSPDSKRLIGICDDGSARVFSTETGDEINRFKLTVAGDTLTAGVWDDARTQMYLTDKQLIVSTPRHPGTGNSFDEILAAWDLERGSPQELEVCGESAIQVSANGQWMITRDPKGDYHLRKEGSKRCDLAPLISRDKHDEAFGKIAFSTNSKVLALLYYDSREWAARREHFMVRDLTTMKNVLLEKPKECCLGDFQFSPSARWVLFGDNYWNTSTGNVNTIVGCTLNPTFTADEKRLMTSCGDGNIKLWDLESGQEVLKIKAHDSDVNTIFMMPDNAHMLTATKKDVSVWRLRF